MDFLQAFPVAIIDEDYDGKRAAGRGMRQLAAAIEQEGFRVVADLSYDDARRLVNVANNESCWLVSVDGIEAEQTRWQILEQVLLAKRRRNDQVSRNYSNRLRPTNAWCSPTDLWRVSPNWLARRKSWLSYRLPRRMPGHQIPAHACFWKEFRILAIWGRS